MRQLPSRLRRLDDALASLPAEEAMLLSELDGFLTAIAVCPAPVPPAEWLPLVWRADEGGTSFDDPADARWFADAVSARLAEINRDLARDRLRPLFDGDDRTGALLWDIWVEGFAEAMDLRPQAWSALAAADEDADMALTQIALLIDVAFEESTLDSMEINALEAAAPALVTLSVQRLHAARARGDAPPPLPAIAPATKPGRNDPCPCGSGAKFKRCCG